MHMQFPLMRVYVVVGVLCSSMLFSPLRVLFLTFKLCKIGDKFVEHTVARKTVIDRRKRKVQQDATIEYYLLRKLLTIGVVLFIMLL
jgi:hypothetical protein